ncbi:uncharacterized protein LODBEIA_P53950 [Lodderomyces beijingensis]|uniref:Reduced viability upon starvation protein n=1 Tax=Lodderomyces beijingensis TaxID=1775926 RepID=A0ABP0ZSQ8_9ASCO
MSFKGIKKTIVRAPQNFRQKMNMGEVTQDPVYQDAERRFKEIEIETKKLSDESKKYFQAISGMLDESMAFSTAIEEIYKPISGKVSDPNAAVPEDNPQGIEAAEQYRELIKNLKETLKPDLELIEKRIVEPAQELLKIIAAIRKMATKRDHKQVDLDRHKRTYSKYETKKERTLKDEEKMYSSQAELEVAQQEYDYYNDMLKQELPVLFQKQSEFISPLFVSFYYMQLNIFYQMYNTMEEMKIPYFNFSEDIVNAYHAKKGNIEEQTDAIGITHFKVGHAKSKLEAARRSHAGMASAHAAAPGTATQEQLPAYQGGAPAGYNPDYKGTPVTSPTPTGGYGYQSPQQPAYGQHQQQATYQQPTATGAPPPAYNTPPPSAETCTALYDYNAQAQGDLTFPAGAVIEVINKNDPGWWLGKYNGIEGVFPSNYVQQ